MFIAEAPAPQESSWQGLDRRTADLYAKGDLPQAIEAAQAALRIAASPKETGRSLDRLGFLYYTCGKLTEGEAYCAGRLPRRAKRRSATRLIGIR